MPIGFKGGMEAGAKLRSQGMQGFFKGVGTPSLGAAVNRGRNLSDAQMIARGKRRTIGGAGFIGMGLSMNAVMGPRGTSATSGLRPNSTGGYA